jgi:hypothetical protein
MHNAAVPARVGVDAEHRCTEFTSDHGLSQSKEGDMFGAAVCPGCHKPNPLTGDPSEFHEQVVRCMGCTHVMVLDGQHSSRSSRRGAWMQREEFSERTLRIDYWDCEDCELTELDRWEKEAHEGLTDHSLVARDV